jgi:hypothetical protein
MLMSTRIADLHIAREELLPTPNELRAEVPVSEAQARVVAARARLCATSCGAMTTG